MPVELPLEQLIVDPTLSPRIGEVHPDHVDDLAESIDSLPPIVVWCIGGKYYIADGVYRYHAAAAAKRTTIRCEVHTGDLIDAADFAATVNLRHGLKLTRAERREVARGFHRRHSGWSLRKIAEAMGCDHHTVKAYLAPNRIIVAAPPVAAPQSQVVGPESKNGGEIPRQHQITCPHCHKKFAVEGGVA